MEFEANRISDLYNRGINTLHNLNYPTDKIEVLWSLNFDKSLDINFDDCVDLLKGDDLYYFKIHVALHYIIKAYRLYSMAYIDSVYKLATSSSLLSSISENFSLVNPPSISKAINFIENELESIEKKVYKYYFIGKKYNFLLTYLLTKIRYPTELKKK